MVKPQGSGSVGDCSSRASRRVMAAAFRSLSWRLPQTQSRLQQALEPKDLNLQGLLPCLVQGTKDYSSVAESVCHLFVNGPGADWVLQRNSSNSFADREH